MMRSISTAVRTFSGYGNPWVMTADSNAITGLRLFSAFLTSAVTSTEPLEK